MLSILPPGGWACTVFCLFLLCCRQEAPEPILPDRAKRPIVEDFHPKQARNGAVVQISGRRFGTEEPAVRVGGAYGSVLSFGNTSIRFVVPDISDARYPIEVYNLHGVGHSEELLDVVRKQ